MAKNDYGFGEPPRNGVTRYVVCTLVACLAVGLFLYADGYFDELGDMTSAIQETVSPQG